MEKTAYVGFKSFKVLNPTLYAILFVDKEMRDLKASLGQKVCNKHEFVTVTQTATTTGIGEPKVETRGWSQCKNCPFVIPI